MADRGRPTKPDKYVPVTILVQPSLKAELLALAAKEGRPFSEVARRRLMGHAN